MAKLVEAQFGLWRIDTDCGFSSLLYYDIFQDSCKWCLVDPGKTVVFRIAYFQAESKIKEIWPACQEHRHYVDESVEMSKSNCTMTGHAHYEKIEVGPTIPMLWRHQ